MDGITILSEYTYNKMTLNRCILSSCGLIFLFIIIVIVSYKAYKEDHSLLEFIITLIIALFFISSAIVSYINDYKITYTDYDVTIDDSVGFNEFYESYEIVSKDEDVYTIREINGE